MEDRIWRGGQQVSELCAMSCAVRVPLGLHGHVGEWTGWQIRFSFQAGEQACHPQKTEPHLKCRKCHFISVPIIARGNDSSTVLIWMQSFQHLFCQVGSARLERNLTHFSVAVAEIINVVVQCIYRQAHIPLTPL